jgi:pimeloyl-ACP methyl ester carboxylesterase
MKISQWTPTLVACALVSICFPAVASDGSDALHSPVVPDLDWAPCGPDFPAAECALATVPLDYDQPRGATTTIALARIAATNPVRKIGSVFLNFGGPGVSGVDEVLFGFGEALGAMLDGRFDIVGFDPRGVAASDPLFCFDDESKLFDFFTGLPVFAYREGELRPFFNRFRTIAAGCLGRGQPIARHMSTADVARDLDLLRRAVGDEKLTYLGFSYGSFLGNTYASLFPNKVRALAIDGVLDPRLWSSSLQVISDRVATQREFNEFLRLCDAADCPLRGSVGAKVRFDGLVASLKQQPVLLDGSEFTYDQLIAEAANAMYTPELWPDYGELFGSLADAIATNDIGLAKQAAATRQRILEEIRSASPRRKRTDYDNSFDAFVGNHCSDASYPSSFALYSTFNAFAAAGSMFGPYWWSTNAACADYPVSSDRFIGPWNTRTSAPVLVVGNYFDGVTDYNGAVASSKLLSNSRLLSYAGWGHTAFGRSECATNFMIDYLRDGSLPPEGTVCPANPNPFLPSDSFRDGVTLRALPMIGLPPLRPTR